MPTPVVVVFDLGKVLVDFDYTIATRKIATQCRMRPDELKKLLDHSPLLCRLETGRVSDAEFFGEVCAATKYPGSLDEFCELFADVFTPIPPMIDLRERLRARGIPTYIFSNTHDMAIRHIRRNFPFFGNFDGYVLSYEHGAMKPDAKLYEVVERTTGRRGAEILYLDDRAENIEAGAARGWQVILHALPEMTLAAVRKLGLPV